MPSRRRLNSITSLMLSKLFGNPEKQFSPGYVSAISPISFDAFPPTFIVQLQDPLFWKV